MNYQQIYQRLIDRARIRDLEGYKEIHHILPRCLGGTNAEENLVALTPEEHYVAHQLLVKIYPEYTSLVHALMKMTVSSYKNIRNNKRYGWVRRRYVASVSGTKNPRAKLTEEQVLEVYFSTESTNKLAEKYNLSNSQISSIKRKRSYRDILMHIPEKPGHAVNSRRIPLSDDSVRCIFFDEGDAKYFRKKYKVGIAVVRNIKDRKTYKAITKRLTHPGQIKLYRLGPSEIFAIKNSQKTNDELAKTYGVHRETVRNIKNGITRAITDVYE